MPPKESLKQTVSELARLSRADREAILSLLDASQRSRVEKMLLERDRSSGRAEPIAEERIDMSGLSPWLVERLNGSGELTDRTSATLGECAAETLPRLANKASAGRARLLGRPRNLLRGGAANE